MTIAIIVPNIACTINDYKICFLALSLFSGYLSESTTKKEGKMYPIATPSGSETVAMVVAITL